MTPTSEKSLTADNAPEDRRLHGLSQLIRAHSNMLPIIAVFILVLVVFGSTTSFFLSQANLLNVLRQSAVPCIIGIGVTFVLAAAGIDLSIGALVSLSSIGIALLLTLGIPPYIVVPLVLIGGAVIGAMSGYLIAYQKLPSFIITLAALSLCSGAAQLIGKGFTVPIETDAWLIFVGQGSVLGLPFPAILAVVLAIVGWGVLNLTPFGLRVRGIGSNEESVRRSGVSVGMVTIAVYMISALTATIGGVILAMRLQSGSATSGTGLELQVIAAAVLGGTSLFGGRGTIVGTILGVITLALITSGLTLNHVDPFYVNIVQGLILVLALWINRQLQLRIP